MNPIYLWVDLAILLPTLALSFDKRVAFYKQWPAYFPVNAVVMAAFIAWDIWFTEAGIWGFNPAYLIGIDLLGLPIEEWGFFIAVPYACTFTYATLKQYFPQVGGFRYGMASLNFSVWLLCSWIVVNFWELQYPAWTAVGMWLTLSYLMLESRRWMSRFWIAYTILLLPFVVCNGVLTGIDFTALPVLHAQPELIKDQIVWYNNEVNSGWRIFSMPADDLLYGALLMLLHVAGFEWMLNRK